MPRQIISFLVVSISILFYANNTFAQECSIVLKRTDDLKQFKEFIIVSSEGDTTFLDYHNSNPYLKEQPDTVKKLIDSGIIIHPSHKESIPSRKNINYAGVSYIFRAYDNEEWLQIEELIESTVLVFNCSGNEIYRVSNFESDAQEPLISSNGNYLGFHYGTGGYELSNYISGFRIYDVKRDLLLHDIKDHEIEGYVAGGYKENDIFAFRVGLPEKHSYYYVFETTNGILYRRKFSSYEIGMRIRFEKDAVIFNTKSGEQISEKYSDTFEVVNSN